MTQDRMTIQEWLRKGLSEHGGDLIREMLSMMAQWLMSADVDALWGAEYGTRSSERTDRRNGYRSRRWDTRGRSSSRSLGSGRGRTSPTGSSIPVVEVSGLWCR